MKILFLGQEPHIEVEYDAIEIEPGEYITWDHLYGFNQNHRAITLDMFESGVVHTEYILPDEVKNQYPDLDLRFDAAMMLNNNHYYDYQHYTKDRGLKIIKNFVSVFSKSNSSARAQLLMLLNSRGWVDEKYSSKHFAISMFEAQTFFASINRPLPEDYKNFCRKTYTQPSSGYGNAKFDLATLGIIIKRSFIHVVAETVADSYVPFPTEKLLQPIAVRTLWIGYAQPKYHQFVHEKMGFELYKGINYDFDYVRDPIQRLLEIEKELSRLHSLSESDKQELYRINADILEHNYQHLKSGSMIEQLKKQDQASDAIKAYRQRMLVSKRYRNYMDVEIDTSQTEFIKCDFCPLKEIHSPKQS